MTAHPRPLPLAPALPSRVGAEGEASRAPLGPEPATQDCRCLCGSLLARVVGGAVELKCRRCKRTHLVPLEPGSRSGGRSPRARREPR